MIPKKMTEHFQLAGQFEGHAQSFETTQNQSSSIQKTDTPVLPKMQSLKSFTETSFPFAPNDFFSMRSDSVKNLFLKNEFGTKFDDPRKPKNSELNYSQSNRNVFMSGNLGSNRLPLPNEQLSGNLTTLLSQKMSSQSLLHYTNNIAKELKYAKQ